MGEHIHSYVQRVARLRDKFMEMGIDGFVVFDLIDIFYLTGLNLHAGALVITEEEAIIHVDGRFYDYCENSWCKVYKTEKLDGTIRKIPTIVGYDLTISLETYLSLKKSLTGSAIGLKGLKSPIKQIRAIKSQSEISKIKGSAELLWSAYQTLLSQIKPGITEIQCAKMFERISIDLGADGLSFTPIIAFGANSAYPHHNSGNTILRDNDVILIDIGVVLDGYASDLSRTILPTGCDSKLIDMYNHVKNAQTKAAAVCKGNKEVAASDAFDIAKKTLGQFSSLFTHALGHGVGLEVHELPRLSHNNHEKLQCGMVVTIEPGVYLKGLGGVRIEDMFLITETSPIRLGGEDRVV